MKLYTKKHKLATEEMRLCGADLRDLAVHLNNLSEGAHAVKQLKKFGKTFTEESDLALAELTLETILEQVGLLNDNTDYFEAAKECRGFISDHVNEQTQPTHNITLKVFAGVLRSSKDFVKRYKPMSKDTDLGALVTERLSVHNEKDGNALFSSSIVTNKREMTMEAYSVIDNTSGRLSSGVITVRPNGTVLYDSGDAQWVSVEEDGDGVADSLRSAITAVKNVAKVSRDVKEIIEEHKGKKLSAEHLTNLNVHVTVARDAIASALSITDTFSILKV